MFHLRGKLRPLPVGSKLLESRTNPAENRAATADRRRHAAQRARFVREDFGVDIPPPFLDGVGCDLKDIGGFLVGMVQQRTLEQLLFCLAERKHG